MIKDPIPIIAILLAVVVGANWWAGHFKNSKLMRILPTPVWCYVPPTILTTLGILPIQSPVYDWISRHLLPACLILLLMTTDMKGLKKIGRVALIAITGSTLAVTIGGIASFFLFRNQLGPENWKAIGTLSASWIGGTANELAVKQATGLSDVLFSPLFIADITAVYVWMTFLMILSGSQKTIDRVIHADRKQIEVSISHPEAFQTHTRLIPTQSLVSLLIVGFSLGGVSTWIGEQIPEIGMAVNHATWVIIVVTTMGLLLASSRYARLEGHNATKIGYFLFYFLLASTGAKAHLLAILKAPLFLGICFVWMVVHGGLLFAFGRFFRIPIAMLATASQANLGGVISAPIVASTYDRRLMPIAVILAIFGYAIGNYAGILIAQLLRLFT